MKLTKSQLREHIQKLVKEELEDEWYEEPESIQDARKRMYQSAQSAKKMGITPTSWLRDFAAQDLDAQESYGGELKKYNREMSAIAEFVWSYRRR